MRVTMPGPTQSTSPYSGGERNGCRRRCENKSDEARMAHRFRTIQDTRTTTSRGYGWPHRKARAAAAKRHRPSDPCVRCGKPLGPIGPGLHYDHNSTRTSYLGFSTVGAATSKPGHGKAGSASSSSSRRACATAVSGEPPHPLEGVGETLIDLAFGTGQSRFFLPAKIKVTV